MFSRLQLLFTNYFLLSIFLAGIDISGFGQSNKKVDSLLNILKTAKEDANKVNLYNALSGQLQVIGEYDESRKYADSSLMLGEELGFKKGIAVAYYLISYDHYVRSEYAESVRKGQTALRISKKINYIPGIIRSYSYIGYSYYMLGNYSEAMKYHLASLKISEETGDKKRTADSYENIGNIYWTLENYREALTRHQAALKIREEIKDKWGLASSYNNIGLVYGDQNNDTEALKHHEVALEIRKEISDKHGMAASYNNIGIIYLKSPYKYPAALDNLLAALKIYQEIGDNSGIASATINLGELNIKTNKLVEAKKYLDYALAASKKAGDIQSVKDTYYALSKLDSAAGNFRQALVQYKLYTSYKDSIINNSNNEQIARLKQQFDSDKKDKELLVLNKEKDLQALQLKRQKQAKNYFIIGLLLVTGLSFFIYHSYRTRQKLKLQMLRNKIASDLHDDIGSTLSSISIFSQMAQEQSTEVKPLLNTIGESSRKMLDAMADIVWTINPENDQFEKIIMRMRSFAYELLGARQIEFRFVADNSISNIRISMETRRNLYLIFKEATNNLVKYAEASRAMFSIKGDEKKLVMMIKDNGKGFDSKKATEGNGLKNMKKRAVEMGAVLMIDSIPGTGTTIKLEMAV